MFHLGKGEDGEDQGLPLSEIGLNGPHFCRERYAAYQQPHPQDMLPEATGTFRPCNPKSKIFAAKSDD